MPEITRRRTGEMLRTLFEFLIPQPDGMQARDALAELERRLTLSEYEQGEFPSGGRRFEKIVRFATVDLVKAGWLIKEKGRWTVTAEGKQAYQNFTDPEAFYKEAARLFYQWKTSQPENIEPGDREADEETPAKAATITLLPKNKRGKRSISIYAELIRTNIKKSSPHFCGRWDITFRGLRRQVRTGASTSSQPQIRWERNHPESKCR